LNEGFCTTCGNYKGHLGTSYLQCKYVVFLFGKKGNMNMLDAEYTRDKWE